MVAGCGSSAPIVHGDPVGVPSDGGALEDVGVIVPDATPGPDGGILKPDSAVRPPPPQGPGRISFKHPDTRWRRVRAEQGSALEDISAPMSNVSPGTDNFLDISKDGNWVVATGSRFGCSSGSCLEVFAGDLGSGDAVRINGSLVNSGEARPVIGAGGKVVVFAKSGPHPLDLFATTNKGGTWSTPLLLTSLSTFSHHHDAAISADGARVVFDCGKEPYGAPPTSICEVGTDGNGFHKVVDPSDGPDQGGNHAPHHPDYAPDGSIVFEADWPSETIWKLPIAGGPPVRLSGADFTDDNSPCVLPDGRVASLWLGRKGNTSGAHEIKVMDGDGANPFLLVTGIDVVDIGIGCGN